MKYCKKCGVLYSDLLEQCPKCNAVLNDHEEPPAPEAPREVKVRQWIMICVGIPAFIGLLYLVIGWLSALS